MSASGFHVLQCQPNFCVPACAEMVLRRRRRSAVDQHQIAASWQGSHRGYSFHDAADLLDAPFRCLDPLSPELPDYFAALLGQGDWIMAQVFCSALQTEHYAHHPPAAPEPHGPLPAQPPGLLHAIVLVEVRNAGHFEFLDPHHRPNGQPFVISRTALMHAFQGSVIVCSL